MASGYLALHLHAHLPFIRHPEHENFLEERWYFDAVVDTYVPLLQRFEQLHGEQVPFRLSMTLSPTLLSMFADGLLGERLQSHLNRQLELSDKELTRTASQPEFHNLVMMYQRRLLDVQRMLARYGGNLCGAFRVLASQGHLLTVTCAATHGFLPHMQLVPGAVDRQLEFACETHQRLLESRPDGIWLPECAYYPGLEEHLLRHGLLYFFCDSHALHLGEPRSLRGVHSHVYLPNGVAAFARDVESSKQVWSAREGYPGDGLYRDFYRDVGFDLPLAYVAPHVHQNSTRILTGFKYYAITGRTEQKNIYNPELARSKAEEHARHFIWCREQQAHWLSSQLDRVPLVVAPYDAELFGHWWFEGPDFLYYSFKTAAQSEVVETIAARDYLLKYPTAQIVTPNPSSWGDGGYYRVWINGANEWIYPHLNAAARLMPARGDEESPLKARIAAQARRELLLAQASDWPFILTTGTSPGYATERIVGHLSNLAALRRGFAGDDEPARLAEMEARQAIFPRRQSGAEHGGL